ncbi:RNA-binding protein [Lactiplantibacillus plantarum]|nr:RNA-binding protein [Lactiplantibacillus plantarum]
MFCLRVFLYLVPVFEDESKYLDDRRDDIKVDFKETTRYLEYNLTVNPEDIGRVIGRQGRVASAIRTIVYSVRVSGPKRVRLTIEDGQQKNS